MEVISERSEKEVLDDCMHRIGHLQVLLGSNLISKEEFESRKSQIVDELTGTSSTYRSVSRRNSNASRKRSRLHSELSPQNLPNSRRRPSDDVGGPYDATPTNKPRKRRMKVIPHPPPDWSKKPIERAEKCTYDYATDTWKKVACRVKIDEVPFDCGGLRYVFHLQDLSDPKLKWVAKMSQDSRDNLKKEIYFNDVRMQAIARHFCQGAKGYNAYQPPKKVDFLEAFVLHLVQREGSPVCHVERYIEGDYIKYNNNVGWVSDDARNTPHAFAHFTYEASKRKLLVCDIQGVNDVYTDPQVHTTENQKAFGKGNLGLKGFQNFLSTHRCNAICRYLRLPNINALPIQDFGTKPQDTYMPQGQIKTVHFDFQNEAKAPLLEEFPTLKEESSCWSWCVVL